MSLRANPISLLMSQYPGVNPLKKLKKISNLTPTLKRLLDLHSWVAVHLCPLLLPNKILTSRQHLHHTHPRKILSLSLISLMGLKDKEKIAFSLKT